MSNGDQASALITWLGVIRRDRKAMIGSGIIAVFVLVGVVGPWVVGDPDVPVGVPLQPPSGEHLLGTTGQGQDVLAQLVVGTRASLAIGFSVGLRRLAKSSTSLITRLSRSTSSIINEQ